MSRKPLEIHPAAVEELIAATAWYRERSPAAAARFAAEIGRSIELVIASPHRWLAGKSGTRRFVMRHFPFAIVYRETETAIQVLAFAHGHRRPGYWRNRL
jgi:plasmid stabilization system protein ParE